MRVNDQHAPRHPIRNSRGVKGDFSKGRLTFFSRSLKC
jgi:hypothetical protein